MSSNRNSGPPPGSRYCSCKRRAVYEHPDTGAPLCDVHYEEDQQDRDMKYLRDLRKEFESQMEAGYFDPDAGSKPTPETITVTITNATAVDSTNYIRVQVIQPQDNADPEKEPYARVMLMHGDNGKYIDYSLAQYKGLLALMCDQLDALQTAFHKHHE